MQQEVSTTMNIISKSKVYWDYNTYTNFIKEWTAIVRCFWELQIIFTVLIWYKRCLQSLNLLNVSNSAVKWKNKSVFLGENLLEISDVIFYILSFSKLFSSGYWQVQLKIVLTSGLLFIIIIKNKQKAKQKYFPLLP